MASPDYTSRRLRGRARPGPRRERRAQSRGVGRVRVARLAWRPELLHRQPRRRRRHLSTPAGHHAVRHRPGPRCRPRGRSRSRARAHRVRSLGRLLRRAFSWIVDEPVAAARLFARKLALVINQANVLIGNQLCLLQPRRGHGPPRARGGRLVARPARRGGAGFRSATRASRVLGVGVVRARLRRRGGGVLRLATACRSWCPCASPRAAPSP